MIPQVEMLITDIKGREEFISPDKGEDIEKWSGTSEPPTADINVYIIDVKEEARCDIFSAL